MMLNVWYVTYENSSGAWFCPKHVRVVAETSIKAARLAWKIFPLINSDKWKTQRLSELDIYTIHVSNGKQRYGEIIFDTFLTDDDHVRCILESVVDQVGV